MKIQVFSDIHIEFSSFTPEPSDADVVVLAGDIGVGIAGLEWAKQVFSGKEIIYVAGNHEFYGSDREQTRRALREAADRLSINFLDCGEVILSGVRFLGATLWTDFEIMGPPGPSMRMAQWVMADFKHIRDDGILFTPEKSVSLHKIERRWLESRLITPFQGPTVVVTHHCPSMLSVPPRFQNSLVSAGFSSELVHLFHPSVPVWIHGHTHDSFDYKASGTRVICNPRGYVMPGRPVENKDFNPELVIEVPVDRPRADCPGSF